MSATPSRVGNWYKTLVVSLVERKGRVRSFQTEKVNVEEMKPIIKEHLHGWSEVMTHEATVYPSLLKGQAASHDAVCHSKGEYVRKEGLRTIHTNTIESFFALFKRGVYGTFRHVSRQHPHRYLDEFDFRYNARDTSDGERAELAFKGVVGKRLIYRDSSPKA